MMLNKCMSLLTSHIKHPFALELLLKELERKIEM